MNLDTAQTDLELHLTLALTLYSFLQENGNLFQLSIQEADYLDALDRRFKETQKLLEPLPTTLAEKVRARYPSYSARRQQQILNAWLVEREARIRQQVGRIDIDSKLLHAFETELEDHVHRVT